MTIQKWGGLAAFLLAIVFIIPSLIYLVGDLRQPLGPFGYDLADFLYGPIWAASLVSVVFVLREIIAERAPRRMNLTLMAAFISAGLIVCVTCIRAANRHYHILHPELNLESSTTVLLTWTTLVAGVTAAGLHFLGWTWILLGSAGWKSRLLPRVLSGLYLVAGVASLFVYVRPELEGMVLLLGFGISVWQGILLMFGKLGDDLIYINKL